MVWQCLSIKKCSTQLRARFSLTTTQLFKRRASLTTLSWILSNCFFFFPRLNFKSTYNILTIDSADPSQYLFFAACENSDSIPNRRLLYLHKTQLVQQPARNKRYYLSRKFSSQLKFTANTTTTSQAVASRRPKHITIDEREEIDWKRTSASEWSDGNVQRSWTDDEK